MCENTGKKKQKRSIGVPQRPHKECNKYPGLHGNADQGEMCAEKKVKEKYFVGAE